VPATLEAAPAEAAVALRIWKDRLAARSSTEMASSRPLRPEQITPVGDWRTWLILAGRGWGKTLAGAEDAKRYGLAHPGCRYAIVARTFADARDTCVEGESGLLSCLPPSAVSNWNRSMGELILTNGTRYKLFSADEPNRLRGPQHHRAWSDEPASWGLGTKDTQWPPAWDMLQFGLRLGDDPRNVATTTPRPTKLIRHLLGDPLTHVTRGRTIDNVANLAPAFLSQIVARYRGTRLGRQELDAEILDDVPGALWTYAMLEDRRPAPDLTRVVVAVDPSGGSDPENDEQGIGVAGLGVDARGYVLADRTCKLSPDGWGRRAVQAYLDHEADLIVYEKNFGGEMVEAVIRTAARAMGVTIKTKAVNASRGKRVRAEPVAALYEQGRVSHCEVFPELEEECTTWTPESGTSPNRMDWLVWALTELMVKAAPPFTPAAGGDRPTLAATVSPGRYGLPGAGMAGRHGLPGIRRR
jgi:predicted phage terminase large subunit-like protein